MRFKSQFKDTLKNHWNCFKETIQAFGRDGIDTHAAALAYYALFAIVPLLLIALSLTAIFLGPDAITGSIHQAISDWINPRVANSIQRSLQNRQIYHEGLLGALVGGVTLIVAGTSVFVQLQNTLNYIWGVRGASRSGIGNLLTPILRQRILSFVMIVVIAVLMLASFLASAVLAGVEKYSSHLLIGGHLLWELLNLGVSFLITALLFGAIYKILPDVSLPWRNVRSGGLITAFFFTITKFAVGLYLGKSAPASAAGAAGGLVILMLWTHAASAIFLFGAEFTRIYTLRISQEIRPKEGFEWTPGLRLSPRVSSETQHHASRRE